MDGVHELGDLAPRDVVARAVMRRMAETGRPHVWLDARHLGRRLLRPAVPHRARQLPRARRGPGPRADPGGAGLPLRLRRDRHRPVGPHVGAGSVRHGRGGLLGGARRQPARLELAARGPRVLPAHRRGAARRARRLAGASARRPPRGPGPRGVPAGAAGGDDRARRGPPLRRRHGRGRGHPGRARGDRRRRPGRRRLGDDQPAPAQRRADGRRRAAAGDARLALARGPPRPRRRAVVGSRRRAAGRRRPADRLPSRAGHGPAPARPAVDPPAVLQ